MPPMSVPGAPSMGGMGGENVPLSVIPPFLLDFTQSSLPTLTSSGGANATAFNASNQVASATAPRQDNGNVFAPGNAPRTNYLLQSNAFATTPWALYNSGIAAPTLTANAGTDPLGGSAATKVVIPASTGANQASVVYQIVNLTPNTRHTLSVWIMGNAGGEVLSLTVNDAVSVTTLRNSVIVTATTGWQLCSLPFTTGGEGAVEVNIGTWTFTATTPTAQAGGTVFLYEALIEPGMSVGSRISTTTSTVSLATKGVMVEPGATNLFLQSNTFTNAAWTTSTTSGKSVAFTASAATSPDGTTNATQAVFSATTANNQAANFRQAFTVTSGNPYCVSIWLRSATAGQIIYLSVQNNTTPYAITQNLRIVTTTSWQRFSLPFIAASASIVVEFGFNTQTGSPQPITNAAATVLMYNGQFETGLIPTSDIITTSATLTRSADSIGFTIPSGITGLTYTFADGTIQMVPASAGSYTVPTNLNRSKIAKITGTAIQSTPVTSLTFGTPVAYPTAGGTGKNFGGDTFDIAWAADDGFYTPYCDSPSGFQTTGGNSNTGIGRLDTFQPNTRGVTINGLSALGPHNGAGTDGATWKATGQISVNGVLYQWIARNVYGVSSPYLQTVAGAQLIKSTDLGATWTPMPTASTGSNSYPYASPMFPTGFTTPYFVKYGNRDYQTFGGPDGSDSYVYAVSNDGYWNNGNSVIVGRCLISALPNLSASDWSFYQGGSTWGALSGAVAIISNTKKCGWSGMQYLPYCGRYVMVLWYYPSIVPQSPYGSISNTTTDTWFDVYEGATPWTCANKIQSYEWGTSNGSHGFYGPLIASPSLMVDGGRTLVMVTAGNYQNSADYTLWQIPITVNN